MTLRPATVAICEACWNRLAGQEPVRLREPEPETCDYCKQPTRSGIYVRRMVESQER
jgi:hypothetical protein